MKHWPLFLSAVLSLVLAVLVVVDGFQGYRP